MFDVAQYAHVASGFGSVALSTGPCVLHTVSVQTAASGQTLKLHDCTTTGAAASGNLIASIDLGTLNPYDYDVRTSLGLVAILSGGTPDITIAYT